LHLQVAIELDPQNPLARYEKASVLAACGDLQGALAEYKALAQLAPGEASVYFEVCMVVVVMVVVMMHHYVQWIVPAYVYFEVRVM
jgi:Flp pilus assembly protein TadD